MIEKMQFVSITGPKADIDRVVDQYLSRYEIHLENALAQLQTLKTLTPYLQINPYKGLLAKALEYEKLLDSGNIQTKLTMTLDEAVALIESFDQQLTRINEQKKELEDQKKDGKSTIRIAYPEDVDPAYFRDKIQSAAAALETPVRLEFSCYPEAELANLLTDGKADLILTGTPPDTTARRFSGDSSSQAVSFQPQSVLPFAEVPQVLLYAASHPEASGISDFRNDAFLFSEADAALQSSRNR